MNEDTARLLFSRGIFLALRKHLDRFETNHGFHKVVSGVLELAKSTIPSEDFKFLSQVYIDPIFGTYPFTVEMIAEGRDDTILLRDKQMIIFDIDERDAEEELERIPHPDWFRGLAQKLADGLLVEAT